MHNQFRFTDSFAGCLQQSALSEGGFENEDSVAAAGFRFEEFARSFAADFLVRSPKEYQAFAERYFRLLKSHQREKALNDSGLHVESSRAIRFATGNAERHAGEGTGRVNRIVMAQDQQLARRPRLSWRIGNTQKIAAMLLRNSFHARATPLPGFSDDSATTISGGFFHAGRFRRHKPAQRRKHPRHTRLQELQELSGQMRIRHGAEMLSIGQRSEQSGKRALLQSQDRISPKAGFAYNYKFAREVLGAAGRGARRDGERECYWT
jgi:hypothetical protein